jgi:hypothetical protein
MPPIDILLMLVLVLSSDLLHHILGVRVSLARWHRMIQRFLGGDGASVLPIELAGRPVDVENPLGNRGT